MRFIALFTLLISAFVLSAQSVETLEAQLKSASTTADKIRLNYQLAETLLVKKPRNFEDKAIPAAKTAHQLANGSGNKGMAARAAYLVGQIYESERNERQQEVWFRTSESFAKQAGDLDLIVKSVIKRGSLASRERNYRRAAQIYEEAFNYFSAQGTSISELAAQYEREKASLEQQKRQLENSRQQLAEEIAALRLEKGQLQDDKSELEATQEVLIREKEKVEEEITTTQEELETVAAAKEEAEQLAEQRAIAVEQLSRDTLEARYERTRLENEAAAAKLRANEIRDLTIIGLVIASFLILFLLSRFLSKRRAARVLEEKNTIIEKERKRSDDLLLNILPANIAEELKATGQAKARKFDKVSVLFSDFKNFTGIAEQMSPEELVEQLDQAFKSFDRIIAKYEDIEKIKTIGDAYMCVSGLSTKVSNPDNLIKAALEMQEVLKEQARERERMGKPFFEARIGVHTGPVVAGVVGVDKFAYDIWGDTVNTAARVETNSGVGKVNISETTYEFIKYRFRCTYRGKIEAKNKGLIDMYYVDGLL